MIEIYKFSEVDLLIFSLALARVSSLFVTMPIVGSRLVPAPVKVLLSLVTSLVIFPFLKQHGYLLSELREAYLLLILREIFFGLFLGFLLRLIFMSIEIAGQILSFSIGLSAAQLLNPAFNDSNSIMEQFETVLATLLFLAINGHHLFFEALYRSFELAPLGVLALKPAGIQSATILTQEVFGIGIKMAGPMMAVILFLNIAMGVIGRAVPQINVFVISFPINILVGLFIFMVSIPLFVTVMESDFTNMGQQVLGFLKGF